MSLIENTVLITDTTLYCVAEDKMSPQIIWTYTNPSGTTTSITATSNDVTTGISTLYVYSNKPGYYNCEVTTEEGTVRTHTVRLLDTTLYTGKLITQFVHSRPDGVKVISLSVTNFYFRIKKCR